MKNVIDLFTRERYDPKEFVNDLPIFSGTIHFDESDTNLDFANTMVQAAMQLPERSKRRFLCGMGKMNELSEAAIKGDQNKVCKLLVEMGFLNTEIKNVKR